MVEGPFVVLGTAVASGNIKWSTLNPTASFLMAVLSLPDQWRFDFPLCTRKYT